MEPNWPCFASAYSSRTTDRASRRRSAASNRRESSAWRLARRRIAGASTLAERSVDFVPFFTILDAVYAQRHDQAVVLALIQILWDAVEIVFQ